MPTNYKIQSKMKREYGQYEHHPQIRSVINENRSCNICATTLGKPNEKIWITEGLTRRWETLTTSLLTYRIKPTLCRFWCQYGWIAKSLASKRIAYLSNWLSAPPTEDNSTPAQTIVPYSKNDPEYPAIRPVPGACGRLWSRQKRDVPLMLPRCLIYREMKVIKLQERDVYESAQLLSEVGFGPIFFQSHRFQVSQPQARLISLFIVYISFTCISPWTRLFTFATH